MRPIASPLKKNTDWQTWMIASVVITFLLRVYILLDPTKEGIYQFMYSPLYVGFAALVLRESAAIRERGFRLMLLCFGWAVLTCFFQVYADEEAYRMLATYLLMMVLAFGICYPMAFVLPEQRMHRGLNLISIVYFALILFLSGAGVYAALTGTTIPSLGGDNGIPAQLAGGRLTLFCYPTIGATFCCLALFIGLYLLLDLPGVLRKIPFLAGIPVIFTALALTDSRTSGIFFSVCFGGFAYVLIQCRCPIKKAFLRTLAALCVAVVAMGVSYVGLKAAVSGVNTLSIKYSVSQSMEQEAEAPVPEAEAPSSEVNAVEPQAVPSPLAEEADPIVVEAPADNVDAEVETSADESAEGTEANAPAPAGSRSLFENLSTFQDRTYVWEAAVKTLLDNPILLLTGTSPALVMTYVQPNVAEGASPVPYTHLHSIFFQTLVTFGIPGLVLFSALLIYILYHAARVFFCGRNCTPAQRFLPLILAFCLAVDLLEIFLSFNDVIKQSNPWFFLIAGYVVWLSKNRIPAKSAAFEKRA